MSSAATLVSDRPRPVGARSSLSYMPALDGVRALAVLGVLVSHFDVDALKGGVFGVDIFFVLSGFLITSIIAPQLQGGTFTTEFYWRRFTRLFPALLVLCLVFGILGPLLVDGRVVASDIVASLLYVANWTQAFTDNTPTFLGHTWSLASEELFYLLWPGLLGILLRRLGSTRRVAVATTVMAVAVVAWRTNLVGRVGFDRIYFGFDTRSDALLVGCVLALLRGERWFGRLARACSFSLAGALAAVLFLYTRPHWSAELALPSALLAGWLVLGAAQPAGTWVHRLLAHPVAVYLGRISYSLYLWHFLVSQTLHQALAWPFLSALVVGIPVSFLCAAASYRFVEQPVQRLRDRPPPRARKALGVACFAVPTLAMVAGIGIFQGRDIAALLHPQPFAITYYGPMFVVRGTPFNVQPDGRSAMWMITSTRPPEGAKVRFDGVPVAAYPGPTGFAIIVPPELTASIGAKRLEVDGADGRPLAAPVLVTVMEH